MLDAVAAYIVVNCLSRTEAPRRQGRQYNQIHIRGARISAPLKQSSAFNPHDY